jgi:hypothetical protein
MVGALGLNKNNRSDCDSSEVIANEEVTYSFSKVKGKMSSIFEPSHLSTLYLTLRECKFIFNHIINFDKIMFARVAQ